MRPSGQAGPGELPGGPASLGGLARRLMPVASAQMMNTSIAIRMIDQIG